MANPENVDLDDHVANLFAYQALLIGILAIVVWMLWSRDQAIGLLYGGGVALINTLLLGARLKSLALSAWNAAARLMGGAAQRFIFTLVSMGFAFAVLALPFLGVMLGMLAGHLVFLLHAARFSRGLGGEES